MRLMKYVLISFFALSVVLFRWEHDLQMWGNLSGTFAFLYLILGSKIVSISIAYEKKITKCFSLETKFFLFLFFFYVTAIFILNKQLTHWNKIFKKRSYDANINSTFTNTPKHFTSRCNFNLGTKWLEIIHNSLIFNYWLIKHPMTF